MRSKAVPKRLSVNDSHGDFRNLLAEELDARAELLLGKPRELGMMAGVEQDCTAVFLVGWHAKARSGGVLAHTINGFAFARGVVDLHEIQRFARDESRHRVVLARGVVRDAHVTHVALALPGAQGREICIGAFGEPPHGLPLAIGVAVSGVARPAAAKGAFVNLVVTADLGCRILIR